MILEFVLAFGLVIVYTYFKKKEVRLITYISVTHKSQRRFSTSKI